MATKKHSGVEKPAARDASTRCQIGDLAVVIGGPKQHLGLFVTVERRLGIAHNSVKWAVKTKDGRTGWWLDIALAPIRGTGDMVDGCKKRSRKTPANAEACHG